ncbi:hypothetical protein [Paenibacillus pini]|uniref:Uncharacterized protein n=1 Tax=Paenibacillus pini JCM 16418 TaxID=1236976 RepID=W7YEZ5_9BACL|nr:hypothetical protein [Paenibacillus pini]GAF09530.1 hypothetical protein JCM16418_3673 [Paenibacillus pini JCM 16418]
MEHEDKRMLPLSHEEVESDGIYTNEWGGTETLHRGQTFPADPVMGVTEWKLSELSYDTHVEGRTDARLIPKKNDTDKEGKITHPRRQT